MTDVRHVPSPDIVRELSAADVRRVPRPDVVRTRDFSAAGEVVPDVASVLFTGGDASVVPDLTSVVYVAITPEEFPTPAPIEVDDDDWAAWMAAA